VSEQRHVAIIMDGAGRWAEARGLDRQAGHVHGMETAHAVVRAARQAGVSHLTLLTFSLANWARPRAEVLALMQLVAEFAECQLDFCVANGVRVTAIGHLDELSSPARHAVERLVEATRAGGQMTLTLALSYGGRADIAHAARTLAARARASLVLPEEIDEKSLHQQMTTAELPPVDLLIRTGGERRLSDFLLYECADAELVFLPEMWPELTAERFIELLAETARLRSARPPVGFDIPPSRR
jgi:undecaprenyl diphosphate synthase